MSLKDSKTEQNLKDAFAGESQANRRYLYFAQKADIEGYNDVAAVFRSTAEGETGHAHGHLEFLEETGDPATGLPIGGTSDNLKASVAGETHEYTDMYPGMAKTARDEGFAAIICGAGMAAHLAGAVAAQTTLPVIGVPLSGGAINGWDSLLATVQMPRGIPVATVAVDGAMNAALLAVQMLAIDNPDLVTALEDHRSEMTPR